MLIEITTITVSLIVLFVVYFARVQNKSGKTFLFSEKFLNKADEIIFDLVKFVFKMYSLLFSNISAFITQIPHKIIRVVNSISHWIAKYTSELIEKITHKNSK